MCGCKLCYVMARKGKTTHVVAVEGRVTLQRWAAGAQESDNVRMPIQPAQ